MKTKGSRPQPKKTNDQRAGHRTRAETVLALVPQTKGRTPSLPKGYLPSVRRAWRDYWESPVAQIVSKQTDMMALTDWAWAENELMGERASPEPRLPYLKYLTELVGKLRVEFGMTPLARTRLSITVGQAKLTMQELNKRLAQAPEADPRFKDWEEA